MPNTLIDMGFNSPIQFFIWKRDGTAFGTSTGEGWSTSTEGAQASARPYITWVRDRIKAAMEAENGGLNWRVSRIFEWVGEVVSARNTYHYGFIIQRLEGGTPSDEEFLVSMNGIRDNDGNPVFTENTEGWGTHSAVGIFTANFGGSDSYIAMHYNPKGTLSSYDVDAVSSDTYNAANDFNPPNSNPYSAPDAFMPDRTQSPWVSGWSLWQEFSGDSSAHQNINRWCLVFNHEVPFIAYYRCSQYAYSIRNFACVGEFAVPRVPADTWSHATFLTSVFHGYGNDFTTYINVLNPDGVTSEEVHDAGTLLPAQHSQFSYENQPRADGAFDRDLYKVWNVTLDKGHLDPEVFCVMGPYGSSWCRLYDSQHGTLLQLFQSFCVPWTQNDPVFPAGYPSNGWFGPRIQTTVP